MSNLVLHDRLSDLPLSIIHLILARVPIRDAIGTSFLSKQWRYTWTTLPHLVFNSDEYAESTANFISNVLHCHKGPIHSFEINDCFHINFDSIEEWILCLSSKDIRELTIHNDEEWDLYVLNSSIYSCVNLIKLELGLFTLHPPPSSFKGFLALTSLDLYEIELPPDGVENLVACCPLLKTLRIQYCSCSEIRIRSPNLKKLRILGEYEKLCLDAPLLAKMFVRLSLLPISQTLVCNYTNLFGCFTNLMKLNGADHFVQYLSIGIDSCHHTLVLHHLRVIKLTGVNFSDTKEVSVVARLCVGAPNLQKLELGTSTSRDRSEAQAPHVLFEDFVSEPNFTLRKLRDVSLYGVCDYLVGMHFIKFLLESSPALETVNLDCISRKALVELLGFRRSSTNASILVMKEPDAAAGQGDEDWKQHLSLQMEGLETRLDGLETREEEMHQRFQEFMQETHEHMEYMQRRFDYIQSQQNHITQLCWASYWAQHPPPYLPPYWAQHPPPYPLPYWAQHPPPYPPPYWAQHPPPYPPPYWAQYPPPYLPPP